MMNEEIKFTLSRSGQPLRRLRFTILFIAFFISSCSIQKQISTSANKQVIEAGPLRAAHIGISIYEPASGKYWYDYQGDKYFVPASNVKIPACYAAMKHLGDSLLGLKYSEVGDSIFILPTGDPTFMLNEFPANPVLTFLQKKHKPLIFSSTVWESKRFGSGWNWDDYNDSYMAERSPFPVYGNTVDWLIGRYPHDSLSKDTSYDPGFSRIIINQPEIGDYSIDESNEDRNSEITRSEQSNYFTILAGKEAVYEKKTPFITGKFEVSNKILSDTLKVVVSNRDVELKKLTWTNIYSQTTDAVLRPMMRRSDNFFAEQLLLMVSSERLGLMNDEKIIDTLLKTDFKDLPQKPAWADGSGLSRYNLFTPQDFVAILTKMKNEFGMERIKNIFPTGGQGTLAKYYLADSNYIYAKTGTLSGVVALSGYLYTKKGKQLIFSVLVNNHQGSGTEVRRAVEVFLQRIRNRY